MGTRDAGLVSSAPNGTPIEADTTLEHQLAPLGPDTLLVRFASRGRSTVLGVRVSLARN